MYRSSETNTPARSPSGRPALVCFSHLRWNLVFQRPQHIMTRLADQFDVTYWEEPRVDAACRAPRLEREVLAEGLARVVPVLPAGLDAGETDYALRGLLHEILAEDTAPRVFWYYTPMMLGFSVGAHADVVVYDCMDELANFAFAPTDIAAREGALLARADIVLCGGRSLYAARAGRHRNIHCIPSGVDIAHFARGADGVPDPADQAGLPRPRLGFYGVIDERMDLALLEAAARARPDWSFVMVGPVVKIAAADLPHAPNIHWLGGKDYAELPAYAAGWDIALMPFARNAATDFISPTKTPEYMAAGLPVVSTAIRDVVADYGHLDAVRIADEPAAFVAQCEDLLSATEAVREGWRAEARDCFADKSWDGIASRIARKLETALVTSQVSTIVATGSNAGTSPRHYDVLVVGAGFAGSVMAERIASESGRSVLVIDKRDHIAGNAFDHRDVAGILVHKYGPHIFHTNSREILDYLSRFTRWRPYEHRVLASVEGLQVPMPINRTTLNQLYGLDLATDTEAEAYLASVAVPVPQVRSSRDQVVSQVGEDLYAKFFEGYTRKQWGVDPSQLDKSVAARVPARTNTDDRYFTDTFQCMPAEGYTAMFARMLDEPRITVMTGTGFEDLPDGITWDHLVWSGPIDEYFGHRLGKLPYRSLRFEHETLPCEQAQPVAVVNYPNEAVPYTRITEYKHLTGQHAPLTSITREYPAAEGDPYYPIPNDEAQALYKRYDALARNCDNVTFVGRLATYRYYNMDQIVGQALATWRRLDARWRNEAVAGRGTVAAE
ncbi:UDP-galactopyranose mutase [Erythrobacter oryzae]|uniref:UDP-galactopyranose mutase n=1 Tax=Erythrobacter oryzae TaxID=3019556 RepID=UPI002556267D|nr:UDP-galactopyranose mutase [Erythrobacter sp. COR-2]